ncbi:MAG TPA: efflux transporter outer membrane subunit [Nevskiaceae bacterium]
MLALCAALAACTVGPRYAPPAVPTVDRYTSQPASSTIPAAPTAKGNASQAQELVSGAAVPERWWTALGSRPIDALVRQALAHNPDLAAAQATLEQSQFEVRAAQGALYPQAALGLGAERTRNSGASAGGSFPPQLYNLYTGQVAVSYAPDVFGLNRSLIRSAEASRDVAADELAAARLSIAGNVVATAITLAGLDDEIAATAKNVDSQRQVLKLTRTQYRLGAIAQFQVFTQESLLATTRAQLTQLEQQRDQALHLLATLVGTFPANAGALPVPTLASLRLPAQLPVSLPSTLVRDRPDIRAAEAQLRGANAQVAVAVARMYPDLQLTANFGAQANFIHLMFDPAGRAWAIAASLAAPLFEGGTLRARTQAAEAAYRAVFAQYQSTVLSAFRNVADVLRALAHDSAFLEEQARALRAAQQALQLVTMEFQTGQVGFLDVLTSETQFQAARVAFARAEAQRFADTAALYVALGGGNWAAADVRRASMATGAPPVAATRDADTPGGQGG